MLRISGTAIHLTRGDTAYLSVEITNQDGTHYHIQPGDVVMLSVKRFLTASQYAFQKNANAAGEIKILPEDTAGLEFGDYRYDVQLTKANGDVHTVIDTSIFRIGHEVTCGGVSSDIASGGRIFAHGTLSGRLNVPQVFGSTDPAGGDHTQLSGRDAPEQHPVEAITGLRRELDGKLDEMEFLSSAEIQNILDS